MNSLGDESHTPKRNYIKMHVKALSQKLSKYITMTIQQLIQLEDDSQEKLKEGDYTFIGPRDQQRMGDFIKAINDLSPTTFSSTVHDALRHKDSVRQIATSMENIPLQIYVVTPTDDDSMISMCRLEEYK